MLRLGSEPSVPQTVSSVQSLLRQSRVLLSDFGFGSELGFCGVGAHSFRRLRQSIVGSFGQQAAAIVPFSCNNVESVHFEIVGGHGWVLGSEEGGVRSKFHSLQFSVYQKIK